ncbi:MAG: hypothetical protein AAF581_05875 [Planctomycetota bacterium]
MMLWTRLLTISAALLLVGCSTTEQLQVDRLPFRVALMPISSPRVIETGGATLDGEATTAQLQLDASALVEKLQTELAQYCFVDVQVLDDTDVDGLGATFDPQTQMIRNAAAMDADLLVELDLRYQPTIWHSTNNSFWLNIPLFLLAGPGMYFLHDNSYAADVELTATFYDSPSVVSRETSLGDQVSRYLSAQNSFSGSALSFPDRIDSNYEYLYSIICPTGFLAQDTATIGNRVAHDVIDDLARQLVASVQSRRQDLLRADHICPVSLDPTEVTVVRAPDGTTTVTGTVSTPRDEQSGGLHMVRLRAADQVSLADIGSPLTGASGELVYPFTGTLRPDSAHIRLEFEVGARDRLLRSFTFAID